LRIEAAMHQFERFLTAHAPTVRAAEQTYDIAARLHRGEALHGEEA
jgi:hypothetical protein